MSRPEVVIVGGGHNGLAAAIEVARQGHRVALYEAGPRLGGLARTDPFAQGAHALGPLHDTTTICPEAIACLGLDEVGLQFHREPPPTICVAGQEEFLLVHNRGDGRIDVEPGPSRDDRAGLARLGDTVARFRPFLRALLHHPPPPLGRPQRRHLAPLARQALGWMRLGRTSRLDLLRLLPMCVADMLAEHVAAPLLAEALAAPGLIGTWLGPWSAGSGARLLFRLAGGGPGVAGGAPAFVAALEARAEQLGAQLHRGRTVRRILVEKDRVRAVELDQGETLPTGAVIACVDLKNLADQLLPPALLPLDIVDRIRTLRCRGSAAKMDLLLSGPLELAACPDRDARRVQVLTGGIDPLERAFDALKYGELPDRPHLDVRILPASTYRLVPEAHTLVSVLVSFVPYELRGGWTEAARRRLEGLVLDRLAAVAPALPERLVASRLLTPVDIEAAYGARGGHIFHGEPALDQLLSLRPTPEGVPNATGIDGLFIGGGAAHPDGALTALPGLFAARACLAAP